MAKIKSVPAVVLNNFRNKYIANEICRGVNVYVHEDPNRTEAIQSAARMWLKLSTNGPTENECNFGIDANNAADQRKIIIFYHFQLQFKLE